MKKINRRKNISALEIRSLAGRAPHERGSALLIVIGTLALVAVFAAVYVSIGRTDRRAAQTFRNRVEQQDNSVRLAEYLSGVVGDDRLDAHVQYRIDGTPYGLREVIDLPYTDWTRRSEVNLNDANERAILFTPTGGPYEQGSLNPLDDFRVQSDPWLASTTPTFLGNPGVPDNFSAATDFRPFGKIWGYEPTAPNMGSYLDHRDWLQISNFAPDGRPVNLYNLRPNVPGTTYRSIGSANTAVGGFDAEPGFGTSPRASDNRPIRRMSNFLSLLNVVDPTDARTFLRAFDPANDGVWVPGYNDPQDIGITGTDLYNIPAVWTMYQRFMFMPMNQPFVLLNRNGDESSWADPDYPPYQYADADGDGFADSRWFELRSAIDENAGSAFGSGREDIQELFDQGDTRYFIAARAVDLSSMVNINTATDGLVEPTLTFPMGSSPAEIDFRRLLTMEDAAGDYASMVTGNNPQIPIKLALNAAPRPYTAEPDLAAARVWNAPERGVDFEREPEDYQFYQAQADPPGDIRVSVSNAPSKLIGRYAYNALRRAINVGGTPSNRFFGLDQQRNGNRNDTEYALVQYEDTFDTNSVPSAGDRFLQYLEDSSQIATNTGLVTTSSGLFGNDDLAELLTYHGINDPAFTSRLERVVDGRFDSFVGGNPDPLQARRMSPLLSNRDLTLDRFGHTRILDANDMRIAPSVDNQTDLSRIGEISRNAMALMALTPRKRMTTLSGFVPLSPSSVVTSVDDAQALTAADALPTLRSVLENAGTLFQVYGQSLAPGAFDIDGNDWVTDPVNFATSTHATMFYGYRGPELALRVAAHAAVNAVDLADGSPDSDVTVGTLVLDRNARADLTNVNNFDDPETDALYQLYPGAANEVVLDIDPNNNTILPNATLPTSRQIVNVYGLEAMPVITEVATFYVYHDTAGPAIGGPGDDDFNPSVRPRVFGNRLQLPAAGAPDNITINGTPDFSNPDYLGQVLAFQLHNPYPVPISLGGSGLANREALTRQREFDNQSAIDPDSNYQFDYYIEYAGRFFKLGHYIEWYPTDENVENYYSLDDPSSRQWLGSVDNPADVGGIPLGDGGRMAPGTATTASLPAPGTYTGQAQYSDFITRNVRLQPGETRVFYVLAEKRFDGISGNDGLDQKWENALGYYGDLHTNFQTGGRDDDNDGLPDGPFGDFRGWTGPAEQWFESQMRIRTGTGARPVKLAEFDPRDGKLLNEVPPVGAIQDPTLVSDSIYVEPTRRDVNEVRLWKKIVTAGEEMDEDDTSGNVTPTYRNIVNNDLLVDRLRLPETLNLEMNAGGPTFVEGTVSYTDDESDLANPLNGQVYRNDNTGISIVNWKSVRRVDSESSDPALKPEPGELAPWMLSTLNTGNAALAPILSDTDGLVDPMSNELDGSRVVENNATNLTATPITAEFETHTTLRRLFDISASNGSQPVQTLVLEPHFKSGVADAGLGAIEDDAGNMTATKFPINQFSVAGTGLEDRKAFLFPGSRSLTFTQPRLTDLLLTWGIGPSSSPDPTRGANVIQYFEREWQTMPEALAGIMGVDDLSHIPVSESPSVWRDVWGTAGVDPYRLFEEGRLAVDRFVPFVNAVPTEDPVVFNPGSDYLRGSGAPAALGVLDRARVFTPQERVTDPVAATPDRDLELALSRPTIGTININTAPVEVLRLLPGLTPSRAQYVDSPTGSSAISEWWGSRLTSAEAANTNVLAGSPESLLDNPDVAAGIVAYRDRIMAAPNAGSHASAAGFQYFLAPLFPSVNDSNLTEVPNNLITEDAFLNPGVNTVTLDRRTMTGIEGLRTSPGFGSLGELLSVRLDPDLEGDTTPYGLLTLNDYWVKNRNLTMELYGIDDEAQGIENEATVVPQVFDFDQVGDTVDDYAEKLAMASGVLNMVSVRSDFYAVWFVVQGYRESDVANLRPEDPLIPSIQKRYMMVVDRSNVIEPGDKPKIVLLKEVPL
jgi:hypothetical protein